MNLDDGSDNCHETVLAADPYILDDCSYPWTDDYCRGLPGEDAGGDETSGPLSPLEDPSGHVACARKTSCEISEELFYYALDNPSELMRTEAIVAEVTGGFEFTDIPSGSLADELQFEEGDVLEKINGYGVDDRSSWPTIVSSLVTAISSTVTYERERTLHTLTVTIDD